MGEGLPTEPFTPRSETFGERGRGHFQQTLQRLKVADPHKAQVDWEIPITDYPAGYTSSSGPAVILKPFSLQC